MDYGFLQVLRTQGDFAAMPGVSFATIREWLRITGEPSGAAKTLLAVARLHPEATRAMCERVLAACGVLC